MVQYSIHGRLPPVRGTVSTEVATTGIVIAAIANTFEKVALAWVLTGLLFLGL